MDKKFHCFEHNCRHCEDGVCIATGDLVVICPIRILASKEGIK